MVGEREIMVEVLEIIVSKQFRHKIHCHNFYETYHYNKYHSGITYQQVHHAHFSSK